MSNKSPARAVVQHPLELPSPLSRGNGEKLTVRGTVLELPQKNVFYGFVMIGRDFHALVWRRVLKESGQKDQIKKGSVVECVIRPSSEITPRVTRIKLVE